MTRVTRDQQFSESFTTFMVSIQELHCPGLIDWCANCITTNKSVSTHDYHIQIPKQKFINEIRPYMFPATGKYTELEIIKEDQEVPSVENFQDYFHEYFDKYTLGRSGKILSNVDISDITISDGDMNIFVRVKYYKSYIPYSVEKSPTELKARCTKLEINNYALLLELRESDEIITAQNDSFVRLRKHMCILKDDSSLKLRETIRKMQAKIRECYVECNKKDECPVCYECIEPEILMVPGCCHTICAKCFVRCDSCPICRETY